MNAEKSDVSIDKLFYFGDKLEVKNRGRVVLTTYIRLVGDAELNRARVFAIRKSAELREKLKNHSTDESVAYIPVRETVEPKTLIDPILTVSLQTFTRDALREADLPVLPAELSSDADLELQENYQKEVDNYPLKRAEAINQYVEARLYKERERLITLTEDELYTYYKRLVISDLCEQEMFSKFREQCVYYGAYRDSNYTKRLFKTFEEFENLPTEIKNQFIEFYFSLDIGTEELKK